MIERLALASLLLLAFCDRPSDRGPEYSGGDTTVFTTTREAYSSPASNLATETLPDFTFGHRLFTTSWVTAPASLTSFDGLGPIFNRVSCSGCHLKDGRGQPPEHYGDSMDSMLVRVSIPGQAENGGPMPHPFYGDQINDRAILGAVAEGRVLVRYTEKPGKFPDGTKYSLRVPTYEFKDMVKGSKGLLFSPRVAPAVFGNGLLEAISEETILALSRDQAKAGVVRGVPNYVFDAVTRKKAVGRFGWKANVSNLAHQSAGAAAGDTGITNSLFPKENMGPEQQQNFPDGGKPELSDAFLAKLVFYTRTLAVPARRVTPESLAGEKLFASSGCAACHVPTIVTSKSAVAEVSNQIIHPYTDLLLHDMGEGLADNRPDFQANGRQWRTAPLWGIGLLKNVNRHEFLLHDGRARGLQEAILWHDGEAAFSRNNYMNLKREERELLLQFLRSL
ncbi:MAG: thiol oxidoreductase [Leptospirales bacterium]|nr:thiol oxidoreductase [Leptospirales bacterium]